MPIRIDCACGKKYSVPDRLEGKRFACKVCGAALRAEAELVDPSELVEEEAQFGVRADPYDVPGLPPAPVYAPEPERAYKAPAYVAPAETPPDYRDVVGNDRLDKLVLRSDATASNAGRMRLSIIRYLAIYPPALALLLLIVFVGGIVGMFHHWMWALVIVAPVFSLGRDWLCERAKFRMGCISPAVVISLRPLRVAVYADMTTGRRPRHTIRIIRANASHFSGEALEVGTPLAAVALYHGSTAEDAWDYFSPTIVQCCIHDPLILAAVMATISRNEWNLLNQFLAQLESHKVGMYKLWLNGKYSDTEGVTKFASALGPIIIAVGLAFSVPPALKAAAEKKAKENGGQVRRVEKERSAEIESFDRGLSLGGLTPRSDCDRQRGDDTKAPTSSDEPTRVHSVFKVIQVARSLPKVVSVLGEHHLARV